LSRAAKDAAKVLDAAGYDVVLLETVGVGQAELDIMHVTDSVSLVLNPTAGDVVQVFKAGIMEIADLYVINKADLPGANRLAKEIAEMIDLCHARQDWRPPIVQTVATKEQGVAEWWEHLKRHHAFLKQGNRLKEKRRKQAELEIRGLLEEELRRKMEETWARPDWQRELELVERREKSPHQVAREWLKRMGLAEGGR
jgi:LAO/AO transport system kinase